LNEDGYGEDIIVRERDRARSQRDWNFNVTIRKDRDGSRASPLLVVVRVGVVLDDDDIAHLNQGQEDVNVRVVVVQVRKVDLGSGGLGSVVPQQIVCTRIPGENRRVRLVLKQVGS
jgi:hypothetical protein